MTSVAARFWAVLVLLLLIAGPSWGLGFTLEDSVAFNDGAGTTGTINKVLAQAGTIAATQGTVTAPLGGPQDVFYFSITVTTGQIDFLGMTIGSPAFFVNPKGVGYLDGAGEAPTAILANSFITNAGEFTFGTPFLSAGETSRRLFVTTEAIFGGAGDIVLGQTVQFMLSSGLNFDTSGIVAPEPDTAALLALGLVGFGLAARSRRARS